MNAARVYHILLCVPPVRFNWDVRHPLTLTHARARHAHHLQYNSDPFSRRRRRRRQESKRVTHVRSGVCAQFNSHMLNAPDPYTYTFNAYVCTLQTPYAAPTHHHPFTGEWDRFETLTRNGGVADLCYSQSISRARAKGSPRGPTHSLSHSRPFIAFRDVTVKPFSINSSCTLYDRSWPALMSLACQLAALACAQIHKTRTCSQSIHTTQRLSHTHTSLICGGIHKHTHANLLPRQYSRNGCVRACVRAYADQLRTCHSGGAHFRTRFYYAIIMYM